MVVRAGVLCVQCCRPWNVRTLSLTAIPPCINCFPPFATVPKLLGKHWWVRLGAFVTAANAEGCYAHVVLMSSNAFQQELPIICLTA